MCVCVIKGLVLDKTNFFSPVADLKPSGMVQKKESRGRSWSVSSGIHICKKKPC